VGTALAELRVGTKVPWYLAPSDEEVPVEDQPYAAADSPIALSPGYIADPDPKKDPKDESEDSSTDYPADGGDDDDDDSSRDDADDEEEEEASEEDEDEEEEHLAPADSVAAASPVMDLIPSAKETKPFETDESIATPPPPPAYRTTARMSIRAQTPIPFPSEAEADILLTIPTPPSSPLMPLSSPLLWIPSPPLPLSSPLPLPPPIIILRTRASMVLMRAATLSTYILEPRSRTQPSGTPPILPIPLPLPLTSTDHRADVLRLCCRLGRGCTCFVCLYSVCGHTY
nr:hypothetical protein [Tanacetum cinerariifolium]